MDRLANEDSLARPEGFEPPTPRSVVSFDAQSQEPKWKTSRDERWLFPAIPADMGAIVGTRDGHKPRSPRGPGGTGCYPVRICERHAPGGGRKFDKVARERFFHPSGRCIPIIKERIGLYVSKSIFSRSFFFLTTNWWSLSTTSIHGPKVCTNALMAILRV